MLTATVRLRSETGEPWSMDFEIDGHRALPIRFIWCGFRVVDSPPPHVVEGLYTLADRYCAERISE